MNSRRLIVILMTIIVTGLIIWPAAAQAALWTGEYFNNPHLQGPPTAIFTEYSPTHDWGAGSPAATLPVDYFSARWTSVQTLGPGSYLITARADDGVRVLVNGVVYIDEWHPSPGNTYTAALTVPALPGAQQYTFVVEYYEATGNAFLQFTLTPYGGQPAGATATVNTAALNVRNSPNPFTGAVLTRIYRGQTYPVIGRNADSSWLQLNVSGVVGWVNASYVIASNLQNVPVTDPGTQPTPPPPVSATATVTSWALNVRNIPNPYTGTVLTRIRWGKTYPVIGKNADSSWLQLNVNGVVGWVNGAYVAATNLQNVPVTDPGTRPTGATATVITGQLNVRQTPDPFFGTILTRINWGETYNVVGRDAAATWLQLNVNGIIGWVNARYVAASNLQNVPVTG
ncbi:MAG: SH3 domain-containing protein [Chloroflexi bacterium]|nr:SH3 domain-containing protein [Chloroflexota bacterium]